MRIGVGGGYPGADIADHVLSRFPKHLREAVDQALDTAADAVDCYLHDGLEAAMNRFNTKRQTKNNSPSGEDRSPDEYRP